MKSLRVVLIAVGLLYGASDLALAKDVTFKVNDVPGYWFDTGVDIAGTRPAYRDEPDLAVERQAGRTDRPGRGECEQSPCETENPWLVCLCM